MNEKFPQTFIIYQAAIKMFSFSFVQIMGLLFFFFGLIILNRCSAMERTDYLTRSLPETMHPAKPDSGERETSRQMVRKSLLYSVMGIFVSLWGVAMFFASVE